VANGDLERAIVEATLAGRHAVAELLADQLRARLATSDNVSRLDDARRTKR
jgi:hypothetical protein